MSNKEGNAGRGRARSRPAPHARRTGPARRTASPTGGSDADRVELIEMGFYIPGLIAATIANGANWSEWDVIVAIRKFQRMLSITCSTCGVTHPCGFVGDAGTKLLRLFARTHTYAELVKKVEQFMSEWRVNCDCGRDLGVRLDSGSSKTSTTPARDGSSAASEGDLPF